MGMVQQLTDHGWMFGIQNMVQTLGQSLPKT